MPLIIGQRFAVAPVGLTITEPLFKHRISRQLISPNCVWDVAEKSCFINKKIASTLPPRNCIFGIWLFFLGERTRPPPPLATTPVGYRDSQVVRSNLLTVLAVDRTYRRGTIMTE
jgi:hypothetical protein